ncbi:TRAP transporter large permease subunit [Acuticoccus sp. MNP-M23]|uniref:TRAP transporter large permease n=1 Tax=Acuticoccus sp. MNP-M23 TaxID=3072793 RepID=UPI002814AC64|nr:TRAP transporter large permease subunit [Acuticoccus sp. MNP-M23]WMS44809.1 TRAP transporter large permease subunit [Acuticoccus sp. MNP-M23]
MPAAVPFTPWAVFLMVAVGWFCYLSVRRADLLAAIFLSAVLVLLIFVFPPDLANGPDTQPARDAFWSAFDTLPKVSGMGVAELSIWLLVGIFALLAIGMPLGFASGFLAVLVLYLRFGPDVLFRTFGTGPFSVLSQRIYGLMTDYVIISVPLFIFMASLLERSGLAKDMYTALNVWLSRTRGGIALVTAIMAIIMAAMSGIIGGEVVLLGLIALPQMLRLGYDQNLAIGTICASGSLGTMIPPSIVLIIYGLVTETSIQQLFTAAFIPGFILASCYLLYIIVRTQLNPALAPLPPEQDDDMVGWSKPVRFLSFMLTLVVGAALAASFLVYMQATFGARASGLFMPEPMLDVAVMCGVAVAITVVMLAVLRLHRMQEAWDMGKGLVAPLVVVFVVLGSIYGGVTGITEAAGMGVVAVLLFIVLRGEFTVSLFYESVQRTFKSTGTILMVTFGATTLAGAYSIAGGPAYVANLITGADLAPFAVILVMMAIFLVLGALMDWVGIVLLVMPVFLPIILGLDLGMTPNETKIWFGILFCVNMQVSFLSPPFGPAAFYLKSVAPPHITLPDIFRGFLPFIALQLFVLALVLFFPRLTQLLL